MRYGLRLALLALAAILLALLFSGESGTVAGIRADDFARGGYLAVLAVVLGASAIAASRMNLPAALKAAGVWILGFLVLIGLYAYRADLREVGDRMLAEIVPGHAIRVAGTGGEAVMVMRGDDRHFHVAADVGGRDVDFLVDTGASMVAIDRATAARLGFDPADLAFTSLVQTANGAARAAMITLPSVKVGAIERRNVRAAVMDAGGDGINLLGMSFLGTLSSVEFQGPRLVLRD